MERAVAFVKEAVKIAPVYYVTGNHEYWLEPSENEQMMQGILAAGACDLDDEAVCIEKGDSSFMLAGLDDQHLSDETLKNLLQEQKNELSIVLAHEPQYLQNYANAGADLVLMEDRSDFHLSGESLHPIRDFYRNTHQENITAQIQK